jgi:hypothetical protein
MTEKHHLLSDQQFEDKFKNCTLAPIIFTHEAHLRIAYIYVTKYGFAKATKFLCQQLSLYDKKFGDGTKFNKTVTVASAKVVHHFICKSKSKGFIGLLHEFPRLKSNFKALIKKHYSLNIFIDKTAKHEYLEPDLLPF